MNILGWQLNFRKSPTVRASPFVEVLPKVRTMRENCDWPPATPPATVEQRTSRILAARQRITYQPIPHEWVSNPPAEPPRDWWLWLSVLLVLLAIGVFSALLLASGGNQDAQFTSDLVRVTLEYNYSVAPAFLSDSMAIPAALVMLTSSGLDQSVWTAVQATNRNDNLAPDGSRDIFLVRTPPNDPNAGVVIFRHRRGDEPDRIVRLQLRGRSLSVTLIPAK